MWGGAGQGSLQNSLGKSRLKSFPDYQSIRGVNLFSSHITDELHPQNKINQIKPSSPNPRHPLHARRQQKHSKEGGSHSEAGSEEVHNKGPIQESSFESPSSLPMGRTFGRRKRRRRWSLWNRAISDSPAQSIHNRNLLVYVGVSASARAQPQNVGRAGQID